MKLNVLSDGKFLIKYPKILICLFAKNSNFTKKII